MKTETQPDFRTKPTVENQMFIPVKINFDGDKSLQ